MHGGSSRRSQGGLDLLGVSDIVLFPKASEALDLLAEAVPVERFASLRRDLAALYAGYYIAELLIDLTDLHDPHPRLFDAARITLRHLGDADLRTRRIMRFELACLRELGLMPALDRCAQCGAAVESPVGGRYRSALACGGVVCSALPARSCRTSPSSRSKTWRRFAFWPARATPGAIWTPVMGVLAPARETVGAVISHVLGHRPRLRPLTGSVTRWFGLIETCGGMPATVSPDPTAFASSSSGLAPPARRGHLVGWHG